MRKLLPVAMLFWMSAAGGQPQQQGAFGFWKGMTLKEAQAAAPLTRLPNNTRGFATKKPPQPVSPFVIYGIVVGRAAGVCAVTAMTEHLPDGSKAFKDSTANILAMLIGRYGNPGHSGEDDTKRELKWINPQGTDTSISLIVHHADDGTVYFVIAYSFSNLRKCTAEALKGL